jgi:glycosyltransferase involved in cell wall biosynthesis
MPVAGAHAVEFAQGRHPSVSVVIPTTLRQSLRDAIQSVRLQDHGGATEVLAIVDRARGDCSEKELRLIADADRAVFTGGGRGAGHARNAGVAAADSDLIAFLDDDDEWLPGKLRAQTTLLRSQPGSGREYVAGSRVVQRHCRTGRLSSAAPSAIIAPGERIENYLFLRRRPRMARSGFFTSSLLVHRELAGAVEWNEQLRRHQDWDWLLRAQRFHNAKFVQVPDVGAVCTVGSRGSISARADWGSSLAWARSWKHYWSEQTYVDFVAGQSLRYAIQARSVDGIVACVREIAVCHTLPSIGPTVLAGSGLMARSVLEHLMTAPRSRAQRSRPVPTGRGAATTRPTASPHVPGCEVSPHQARSC